MGSEEFYEIQAKIQIVRACLESCIVETNNINELKDLKSYLEIALDEVRDLERRY